LGQYGPIADDREEDLFASDSDQLGFDQFLRTPGASSDVSHDVEQHDSFPADFSPILECLENSAYTPDFVLSGSNAFDNPTSSYAEGYHLLSESPVERCSHDMDISGCKFVTEECPSHLWHSVSSHQIMEGLQMPLLSARFASDTVSDWDPFVSVDFVAMEF
jgi:hypothetical protein